MKRKLLTENDYVNDGFCQRRFDPKIDGWRNVIHQASEYPCVAHAQDVIRLFEDLNIAQTRIWEQEQELVHLRRLAQHV